VAVVLATIAVVLGAALAGMAVSMVA